jgi:hypothetical protein
MLAPRYSELTITSNGCNEHVKQNITVEDRKLLSRFRPKIRAKYFRNKEEGRCQLQRDI